MLSKMKIESHVNSLFMASCSSECKALEVNRNYGSVRTAGSSYIQLL